MRIWLAVTVLVAGAGAAEFEAASIKRSLAEPGSASGVTTTKGRVAARNVTLRRCIRGAYGVPEALILGGPKWVDEERYDIDATAAGAVGDSELMVMLQALLKERFQLSVRRETRLLPGYALAVGGGGVKAKAAAPDASCRSSSRNGAIEAAGCGMGQLAVKLSESLHARVVDDTKLEGTFSFKLEWVPEAMAGAPGPSIFTAVQEQLGLKLQPQRVPTEVLVIDRAEKASAN